MISIPAKFYSPAIWNTIEDKTGEVPKEVIDLLREMNKQNAPATVKMRTAFMLYRCAKYFKPKVIAEIGTYIGRSTAAMHHGNKSALLYTCDAQTNILDVSDAKNIFIHPMMKSTQMFEEMIAQEMKVDMFFFDGRIQEEDIPLIEKLSSTDCVYLFDDFEGIEKGVVNAIVLSRLGGMLVHPHGTLGMQASTVEFKTQ